MKQRRRIYYSETQKALMWDHWQKGESIQQIAQLFDRNHGSIQRILAESGGIRPAQRHRVNTHFGMAPASSSFEKTKSYSGASGSYPLTAPKSRSGTVEIAIAKGSRNSLSKLKRCPSSD